MTLRRHCGLYGVFCDSVTSIGEGAFCNCSNLTSIKYRGTEEQWNDISKGINWDKYYYGYKDINYTITYNYARRGHEAADLTSLLQWVAKRRF